LYLLDTSALSEPLRRRPHPRFSEELKRVPSDVLYTSSVRGLEMRFGSARPGDISLWDRIQRDVLAHVHVLPFGEAESVLAGDLLAKLQETGQSIGIEDVQIAATVLVSDLAVVTATQNHFTRIPGLRVLNWMV